MDATEKRKNNPSGHENHHGVTCSRCGWPYPNPHPSAKHRRAHKKICGKVQGFTVIGSDGNSINLAVSDDEDERQTQVVEVPEIDKRGSSGFGKGSNSRSEDDLFSDAATEFSDSAFSPGDSGKNVKKTAEGDLDSSPSSNTDENAGSSELLSCSIESNKVKNLEGAGNPDVSVAEDNTRDTKIIEEHVEDEIRANVPENPIRDLNESFEAEIKAQDPDGSISTPSAQDVGSDLDTSSIPRAVETIHHREEKSGQGIDVRNHGDLKAFDSTNTEWEKAFYNRSVAEDIPVIGNLDTLIKDFKDHRTVMPNLPLTLGSDEVTRPLADGGRSIVDEISYDTVMHTTEDSVHCAQIETDVAQDTDAVGKGDLVEDSNTKSEDAKAVYDPSVAKDLPVGDDDRDVVDETSSTDINGVVEASVNSVQVKADVDCGDLVEGSHTNSEGDKALNVLLLPRDLPLGDGDKDLDEIISATNMNVVEDSINSAQIVADAEQNTDVCHGDSVKNTDPKIEVDEALSVSNDLPVAEHRDEDLKDHQILKSEIPLMLGIDGVCKPLVDGDKMVADDTISIDKMISDDTSGAATNPILNQSTSLPGGDSEQEKMINEFSDIHSNECPEAIVAGNCTENTIENHVPLGMTSVKIVPGSTDVDIGGSNSRSMCKNHPGPDNSLDVDSQEVVKETKINNDIEVVEFISADFAGSESIYGVGVEESESILEEPILKKSGLRELPNVSEQPVLSSSSVEHSHNRDSEPGAYPGTISEPMLEKVDDKLNKHVGAADISAASSSRNSLEGNWGSVSVLSTQSDAQASVDAETLLSSDSQAPTKLDKDNFVKSTTASDEQQLDQSDVFEPPSFMTLVEQGSGVDHNAASSEILAVQNFQQLKPESTTNVSESERKKNEEVIAKVTNWSTGKHESTPLKSLLGEAYAESKLKSPNSMQPSTVAQKDEAAAGKNAGSATTVKLVLSTEVPADQSAKREAGKEWNSPARYQADSRKGRKKMKGRPSWVPFVCCSSVNVN